MKINLFILKQVGFFMITEVQKELFAQVRAEFGEPVRTVELTDDMLCNFLKMCVESYAEKVQFFIMEANWANLYGKNVTNLDLAYNLSVRTLDMAKDYSYYFSKEVGLQQRGPWVLNKDFFKIECGKQSYYIPPGREINKVLWITPPVTDAALWGSAGGLGGNFGSGVYGQTGWGGLAAFNGMGNLGAGMGIGIWAWPFADVSTLSADLKFKNQFIRPDLEYFCTAAEDGGHIIHLINGQKSPFTFGIPGPGQLGLRNCTCWYTYYETNGNEDECRRDNPDVLLTPDQVPLKKMDFELLNGPTQNIVRNLLIAKAARALGFIRGKFSGNINMISSPLTLDYNMLINYADKLWDKTMEDLEKRLENLSPFKQMENQANLVDNMLKAKKGTPLGMYVI